MVSVVEKQEDKGAVCRNLPVEIGEFEGTSRREYSYYKFPNESNVSSDVGSWGKDLVGYTRGSEPLGHEPVLVHGLLGTVPHNRR